MTGLYLELVNSILHKQRQAIGRARVIAIGSGLPTIRMDEHGNVTAFIGMPERGLEDVVRAFMDAFPLSKSIIMLQLTAASRLHPGLSIPRVGTEPPS